MPCLMALAQCLKDANYDSLLDKKKKCKMGILFPKIVIVMIL